MMTDTHDRIAGIVQRLHDAQVTIDRDAANDALDAPRRWFSLDITLTRARAGELLPEGYEFTERDFASQSVGRLLQDAEALTRPLPVDGPGVSVLVVELLELIREARGLGY